MADIKINGAKAEPDEGALSAQYQQIIEALMPQIETMQGVMIRGIVVQCQGVPAHVLANIFAAACAKSLASLLVADIQTTMMLRNGLVQAFKHGIKQVPAIQPVKGPVPQAPQN